MNYRWKEIFEVNVWEFSTTKKGDGTYQANFIRIIVWSIKGKQKTAENKIVDNIKEYLHNLERQRCLRWKINSKWKSITVWTTLKLRNYLHPKTQLRKKQETKWKIYLWEVW